MLAERGSKGNVIGMSCPDPLDRIKNDSSLCMLNEFTKSKMNDLKMMKAKGGHSWPPVNVEEISTMFNAAISVQRPGLGAVAVFRDPSAWRR